MEMAPILRRFIATVALAGLVTGSAHSTDPVLSFWYGKVQTFRKIGIPQRYANVLGNVSDPDGILSLEYTLNGGPPVSLSRGPNVRRLVAEGDFNIDLAYAQLLPLPSTNSVVVTATDSLANVARDTVTVQFVGGTTWPSTYTMTWANASSLADSAQVVDGLWSIVAAGVRTSQVGYDRAIAIGDTTWGDVEVTVPVTIHSFDSSGYTPESGQPSVGFMMRWKGHTDDPISGWQPKSGFNPFGSIGFYSFYNDAEGPRLEMYGNGAVRVAQDLSGKTLLFNTAYYFKMQVQTVPAGPYYRFKVWRVGDPEPPVWDLTYQASTTDPLRGSLLLLAHHVDATFGAVQVAPTQADVTPPVISDLSAAVGRTTAEVTWTTDEHATTKLEYGLTTGYGTTVESSTPVTDHSVVLTGLTENTLYHYKVTSADGVGNSASSGDRTFITTGAPTIVSDEFDGSTLNTSLWTFIDPLGDGTQTMTGSQLSINAPAGTAHDNFSGGNFSPRVMQSINNTDFEVEMKFDSPMSQQYQITGLVIQQNPSNYIRCDFNSDGSGTRVFAATIVNDAGTAETGFNDVVASNGFAPLYMRVKRERNIWTLSYSLNGTTWQDHATFKHDLTVTAIGLFAGNNDAGSAPSHTGLFDYFRGRIPATPSLVAPADGATDLGVDPTFTWTWSATAESYHLQVATDSTFATGLVLNDSTIVDTVKALAGLANSTEHFWRVRAMSTSGSSPFSEAWSFTTIEATPDPPALVSPANGVQDQPLSLLLLWRRSALADFYRLQVGTDSTFATGLVVNDTSLVDTSRAVGGLANATRYYWRVNGRNDGGEGSYSAVWSFTTVVAVPGVPVLLSPANGATNLPSTIDFAWTRPPNSSAFHLQVGTDSSFASGLFYNDSTLVDSAKTLAGFLPSSMYYWRVRAKNAGGWSPFTSTYAFGTELAAPELVYPSNNSTGEPTNITLVWKPVSSATSYRLQLGTDSTFQTGLIKNDSTITDTSRFIVGLIVNTKYYWRVNGRDAGGNGPFSPTWSFRTGTPMPDQVQLVSPSDGQAVSNENVRLSWRPSQPFVNRYWVDVAADSSFTFAVTDSGVVDTTTVISQLLPNRTYYWRVRAGNPGGWGPFSVIRRFNTIVTGIGGEPEIPREFALGQNYPNPFNPSTVIEYALPRDAFVRIEIYDLLGQRVAMLVEDEKSAGYHTVRFDAARFPSGAYYYRFTAGEVSFVKKMVLVK
jgi:hypothetical protein